jgi:hypothetical protein
MSTSELEKLRLKLDRDGDGTIERTYDIYPITGEISISSTKDALSVAPPGLSARENILLGVSGMQADISVPFAVHDDGTDRANGTHTEPVTTLTEQNRYLEDVMHAPDFAAGWKLDHLTGDAFDDDDVFVEGVEITSISADSSKWRPATLRLRRGSSIA